MLSKYLWISLSISIATVCFAEEKVPLAQKSIDKLNVLIIGSVIAYDAEVVEILNWKGERTFIPRQFVSDKQVKKTGPQRFNVTIAELLLDPNKKNL